MFDRSINESINQKTVKNAHHKFWEPNFMSSNVLLCPTYSPKPKDLHSAIMKDEDKEHISEVGIINILEALPD